MNIKTKMLGDMLEIQSSLNRKVDENWKDRYFNWKDAIMVEAVELFDHLPWKWWKAAPPLDIEQVQMEAIDIWHFLLSYAMNHGYVSELDERVRDIVFEKQIKGPVQASDVQRHTRELIKAITSNYSFGQVLLVYAFLCQSVGLPYDLLYKKYIGKAQLNALRWSKGYGTTYKKNWGTEESPMEDNQYLSILLEQTPIETPEFPALILKKLFEKYEEVERE